MSDYSELKRLAEASIGFDDVALAPDVILGLIAEVERMTSVAYAVHGCSYMETLAERDKLKAENEALRKAITAIDDSLYREYWSEYAGLEGTRAIIDCAMAKEAE